MRYETYIDPMEKRMGESNFAVKITELFMARYILMYLIVGIINYYNPPIFVMCIIGTIGFVTSLKFSKKEDLSVQQLSLITFFEAILLYFFIKVNELNIAYTIIFNVIGLIIGALISIKDMMYAIIIMLFSFGLIVILNIINLRIRNPLILHLMVYACIAKFMIFYVHYIREYFRHNIERYTLKSDNTLVTRACLAIHYNIMDNMSLI